MILIEPQCTHIFLRPLFMYCKPEMTYSVNRKYHYCKPEVTAVQTGCD